jgi:hypothetical protein
MRVCDYEIVNLTRWLLVVAMNAGANIERIYLPRECLVVEYSHTPLHFTLSITTGIGPQYGFLPPKIEGQIEEFPHTTPKRASNEAFKYDSIL